MSASDATWKARLGWFAIRVAALPGPSKVPRIVPESPSEVNRTGRDWGATSADRAKQFRETARTAAAVGTEGGGLPLRTSRGTGLAAPVRGSGRAGRRETRRPDPGGRGRTRRWP